MAVLNSVEGGLVSPSKKGRSDALTPAGFLDKYEFRENVDRIRPQE
jgi:hypothetical protein